MLTPTSKVFLPLAGVALLLGAIYKILTGDLLGGVLYLMVGTMAFLLGVMLSTVRENEFVPAVAPDAPPPGVHPVVAPAIPGGGGWPMVGAVSLALIVLGLVQHQAFLWGGLLVGLAAGAGWLARSASESTGRHISLMPVGLPVMGLFAIGSVMFFISRILLAVPETASWIIALAVAMLLMAGATVAAVRPNISGRTLTAALALVGVLMIGGGLVAAARGEREIEQHSEEGVGEAGLVQVKAENIAFTRDEIDLKADAEVEIRFDNNDRNVQHNITILGQDPSKPIFRGELVTGVGTATYTFHAPPAGEYNFQCDVHPAQMKGKVKVA
ncbi:MAG: cupredoxin domain-containing protein [Actinomycetota bacterium]|nr:cupredoxin domain-containing protein [Actinomycetota bacterium]